MDPQIRASTLARNLLLPGLLLVLTACPPAPRPEVTFANPTALPAARGGASAEADLCLEPNLSDPYTKKLGGLSYLTYIPFTEPVKFDPGHAYTRLVITIRYVVT